MTLLDWRFSDAVCQSRKQDLMSPPSFEEIAESIKRTMRVRCSHVDQCDDEAGYQRTVYCVVVEKPLFDLFFNSKNGYRAWYFRSCEEGVRKNELFLKSLAPDLIESQSNDQASAQMINRSLNAASAKAWLAEVGKGFCPKCEGDWNAPHVNQAEILNGRWEHSTSHSGWGSKAPFLEKIRILGAFVNEADGEYIPPRKRNRAGDIHKHGWS